jgi:hypothetical protein
LDSNLTTPHYKAVFILVFELLDYLLNVLVAVGEPLFEEGVYAWKIGRLTLCFYLRDRLHFQFLN